MQSVSLASLLTNIGTSPRYVIDSTRKLKLIPATSLAFEHDGFSGEPLGLLVEPASTNYFPDSENLSSGVFRSNASISNTQVMGRPKSVAFGTGNNFKTVGANFSALEMDRVAISFFVKCADWSAPIIGMSYDPKANLHFLVNGRETIQSTSDIKMDGPLADASFRVRANLKVVGGVLNRFEIASSSANATKNMFISGIQVEKEVHTSYIPTTGTIVSRDKTAYRFTLPEGELFNPEQGTIDLVYTSIFNSNGAALTVGDPATWASDHISLGVLRDVIDQYSYGASFNTTGGLKHHYHYDVNAKEKNCQIRMCYSGYGIRYVVNQSRVVPFKDYRAFKEVAPSGQMSFGEAIDGTVMSGYITMFNTYARTFTDTEMLEEITEIVDNDSLINRTAGAVFRTDVEALMYQNVVEPPTPERVLAAWPRTSGPNYFSDPAQASGGNVNEWYYDDAQYSFVQPINSGTFEQILSPIKLDSYVFEAILSSPNSDDDYIGLVAASDVFDGELCSVVVGIHAGGMGRSVPRFSIEYMDSTTGYSIFSGQVLSGNDIISGNNVANGNNAVYGWNGKQIKVRIIRNGNVISARISDWNGSDYMPESEIYANLSSLPRKGSRLAEGARYGFCTLSQAYSTYLEYNLQSDKVINETKIYSAESNSFWRFSNGSWGLQTDSAQADLLPASTAINPKTKEAYAVSSSGVEFDSSTGVSDTEATLNLPASTTTDIEFSEIINQFEFSDELFYAATYNDTNLISEQVDGKLRIVTEATDGYFYILLRTSVVYDNFGIDNETIAFRKVNVQVS